MLKKTNSTTHTQDFSQVNKRHCGGSGTDNAKSLGSEPVKVLMQQTP